MLLIEKEASRPVKIIRLTWRVNGNLMHQVMFQRLPRKLFQGKGEYSQSPVKKLTFLPASRKTSYLHDIYFFITIFIFLFGAARHMHARPGRHLGGKQSNKDEHIRLMS